MGTVALDDTYGDDSYDYGEYGDDSMGAYDDTGGMIDPNTGLPIAGAGGADGNKANEMIESLMSHDGLSRRWVCLQPGCDFSHLTRQKLYNHVDSRHVTSSYTCPRCPTVCPTRNALMTHGYRVH